MQTGIKGRFIKFDNTLENQFLYMMKLTNI